MVRFCALALLVLALSACRDDLDRADHTPAGWPVRWKEQGTLAQGFHTKAEIYDLFDAAMIRAADEVELAHGIRAAAVLKRARRGGLFVLVDHWHFPAAGAIDVPGEGFASGMIDGGSNVTVAFYNRAGGGSYAASNEPQISRGWMIYYGPVTGFLYWGDEVDGRQFPALGYELAHEWGF